MFFFFFLNVDDVLKSNLLILKLMDKIFELHGGITLKTLEDFNLLTLQMNP